MERHRGKLGWVRKWLANPVASLVLVAVLLGDGLTLHSEYWGWSIAGGFINNTVGWLLPGVRSTMERVASPDFFVVRDDAGMRFLDPESGSWDELSRVMWDSGSAVAECSLRDSVYGTGFWAFTSEHHARLLHVLPMTGEWNDAEISAARSAAFSKSSVPPAVWRRVQGWMDIAGGDTKESRILWWGAGHDLVALALLAALLYSLTGWEAWLAAKPWSRSARRRRRGLCVACGYDLQGIEGGVCPECGKAAGAPRRS